MVARCRGTCPWAIHLAFDAIRRFATSRCASGVVGGGDALDDQAAVHDDAVEQKVEAVGVGGAQEEAVAIGVELGFDHVILLEKAGVKDQAVEVILEGSDQGQINTDPKSPGPIAFARSLPIAKARRKASRRATTRRPT